MTDAVNSGFAASLQPPVLTLNRSGTSRFVILCDHASNRLPDPYGNMGLTDGERLMHVAWDPGALAVSKVLSEMLDAPLVQSTFSRLIIDPNRAPDAPDLIPEISENTRIPGNTGLEADERQNRIATFHAPYHDAIAGLLDARRAAGVKSVIVSMHSFTPVYDDVARPWTSGIIHGADKGFSEALFDALKADQPEMNVGWNAPYAAEQGVYHTVGTHADGRDLPGTMVEVRNDEILEPLGVARWARRLARCLDEALSVVEPAPKLSA